VRVAGVYRREAGEPLVGVADEACLAHLAVGNHVDAAFGLPAHGIEDGLLNGTIEVPLIARVPGQPISQQRADALGPGDAANVSSEYPIRRARPHTCSVLSSGRGVSPKTS
jgi:hypothetical protein